MKQQLRPLCGPDGIARTDGELCVAVRGEIISAVEQGGGHLASNLGVVEMTVALHRVFDPVVDRLVFDVGHQCYAHKWLTGRSLQGIRTSGGVSGFPKTGESDADAFGTGHASTAISAALGLARARDQLGQDHSVVAIVGDGALTGGMCYEALCDAGATETPLIVVLNDNKMSIARSTGAMHSVLTRLRGSRRYHRFKQKLKNGTTHIPWAGRGLLRFFEWGKNVLGLTFVGDTIFEHVGFSYLGPIDGHDIDRMTELFVQAKELKKPVVIHLLTQKGKGHDGAEESPEDFHGVEGLAQQAKPRGPGASLVFGRALEQLAQDNPKIVAITAAMPHGTGLAGFAQAYPDRFFDVGIAEEHALTLAAGLAIGGVKPVVALYGTFMQRAVDQLLHDVALQTLPVVVCIDRAGPVGNDGETHQGIYDFSMIRGVPGLTVLSPASDKQMRQMLAWAVAHDGPVMLRYARGPLPLEDDATPDFAPGSTLQLVQGSIPLYTTGAMAGIACKAAALLAEQGIALKVIQVAQMMPLCVDVTAPLVFTLEENALLGGFGEGLAAAYSGRARVVNFGVGSPVLKQASYAHQMREQGLDAQSLTQSIAKVVARPISVI